MSYGNYVSSWKYSVWGVAQWKSEATVPRQVGAGTAGHPWGDSGAQPAPSGTVPVWFIPLQIGGWEQQGDRRGEPWEQSASERGCGVTRVLREDGARGAVSVCGAVGARGAVGAQGAVGARGAVGAVQTLRSERRSISTS